MGHKSHSHPRVYLKIERIVTTMDVSCWIIPTTIATILRISSKLFLGFGLLIGLPPFYKPFPPYKYIIPYRAPYVNDYFLFFLFFRVSESDTLCASLRNFLLDSLDLPHRIANLFRCALLCPPQHCSIIIDF